MFASVPWSVHLSHCGQRGGVVLPFPDCHQPRRDSIGVRHFPSAFAVCSASARRITELFCGLAMTTHTSCSAYALWLFLGVFGAHVREIAYEPCGDLWSLHTGCVVGHQWHRTR